MLFFGYVCKILEFPAEVYVTVPAGHSVFPSVQDAMEHPEKFPAVLNVSFLIIATLCSFLGLAGYYMYGSGVLDVVTFNMRAGKMKMLCAAMILVNPIAKFAITQVRNCRASC